MPRPILYMLAVAGVGVGFVLVILYVLYGVQTYLQPASQQSSGPNVFEKTKLVEVTDYEFKPKTGTVKFGDRVTWKNIGTQAHTVRFRFISKYLNPGEVWSWTIGRDIFSPGENVYGCDLHRGKGIDGASLVVAEN